LSHLTVYLISQTISTLVGVWCWERRKTAAGAGAYAMLAFSQALWTLGYVAEASNQSLAAKLFWDNFQVIGGAGWAVSFVVFVLKYTEQRRARAPRTIALLSFPFVTLVVLTFTDRWHHLVRSNVRLVQTGPEWSLLYDFGPAVWGAAIFGYGLYLMFLGLLAARYLRGATVYRRQAGLVLLGNSIPLVGTALSLTILRDTPNRDLAPITFGLANAIVGWALIRWRLFDLVPVAKDAVVASMSDAVFVVDAHGRILDLNPAAHMMSGAAQSDRVIGRPVQELAASWPALVAHLDREDTAPRVIEVESPSGHRQHIEVRVVPMQRRDTSESGRIIVARDVSERKAADDELERHRNSLEALVRERTAALERAYDERIKLEGHLHQSQKMEAIGRLAGGIAHDFNNLLTVIIGSAELMRDQLPGSPELESILQASRQATALTRQLLAFSRKEVMNPVALNLNEVLSEMAPMLRLLITANIELVIAPDPGIGHVMADPTRVQQVVMNLAVNARDAMPSGGRIRIETSEVAREAIEAGPLPAGGPARFVALRVSDTGVGMDRATRERALEPFFTTKAAGKGTGLGLSTVHGIVEQSGGIVEIESAPGQGTTVSVYLPRIDSTASPRSEV
jgi:PAS domain S-box-containing protein